MSWAGAPPASTRRRGLYQPGQPYDPARADYAVRLPALVADGRFWQLIGVSAKFWAQALAGTISASALSEPERKRRKAIALRQAFVDMGAAFIKVGQFLSVRRDILPAEVAEELQLLQDRVPEFSLALVRQTVKSDLGAFPEEIFAVFEPEPIASASIGQVHRARLDDGRWVVVKVQRSDLGELFYRDLGYMRMWARTAMRLRVGARPSTWLELSDEFGRTLFTEIDYIEEGRNADRLRRSLRNLPDVIVPRVLWKHTGRRVLTLEYVPGTKIDNVAELSARNIDLTVLGNRLVECYMQQVVFNGFFHADPHPGNLAVTDDGKLVIYDYGMMGEISAEQRAALAGVIAGIVCRDPMRVVAYLSQLGVVDRDARQEPVARTLSPFIDYYSGRSILDLDFKHLENDIDQVVEDQAFRLPATLAYLIRAASSLEGLARTLQPNFSFVAAARPVLKRWLAEKGFCEADGWLKEVFEAARSRWQVGMAPRVQAPLPDLKVAASSVPPRRSTPARRPLLALIACAALLLPATVWLASDPPQARLIAVFLAADSLVVLALAIWLARAERQS